MKVRNFARFYASFLRLPSVGDREELKETLVSSFTDGRTTSLREMTRKEYDALCASLEERTGWREALKRKRSRCLRLMLRLALPPSDP